MKYSKMMTILENSRSNLENEEFFGSSPKPKTHSLKSRLSDMKKSKAHKKDVTLFSSPIRTMKSPTHSQGSIVFINSSSFHMNQADVSKSMSMTLDFNLEPESHFEMYMLEEEKYENSDKDDSFVDQEWESPKLPDKSAKTDLKKFTVSMAEKDYATHMEKLDKHYDTSVILNKKVVYYDEEGIFYLLFILTKLYLNINRTTILSNST